jgi:hypothetical protein
MFPGRLILEKTQMLFVPKKPELSPQDRMWILYVTRLLNAAVDLGKRCNQTDAYGDYQLLLAFYRGDEEKAGTCFAKYCINMLACPLEFIEYCETLLCEEGSVPPTRPLIDAPEAQKYMLAAE